VGGELIVGFFQMCWHGDRYRGNASLVSLHGLDAVVSVGGAVWINGNPTLSSLEGLGSLTSAAGAWIAWNSALPTCLVVDLLEQFTVPSDGVLCVQGNLADACAEPSGFCGL
jgi:hypothetical protein